MKVYETERFRLSVDGFDLREFVDDLNSRIRRARTRAEVTKLVIPRGKILLDKQGRYRLLATIEYRDSGNEYVLIWHEALHRDDPAYTPFRRISRDLLLQNLDWGDVEQTLSSSDEGGEVDELPLPAEFLGWFEPLRQVIVGASGTERFFLESHKWTESVASVRDRFSLYSIVSSLCDKSIDDWEPLAPIEFVDRERSPISISVCKVDQQTLMLLDVSPSVGLSSSIQYSDPVQARRDAARAYPEWALYDEEIWLEIQDNKEANMALSAEESALLEGVAGSGVPEHTLPLFINGQAGSGKSTMLAYLFAGLCKKKADSENLGQALSGLPLYLTYSDRLLDSARKAVRRLLDVGPDQTSHYQSFQLEGLFKTWHQFLVESLPADRAVKFDPKRRVDFWDFKNSMTRGPSRLGRYDGPQVQSFETAWFVIRSLIKGNDGQSDMTVEGYEEEVARSERVVSEEEFRRIFEGPYLWYRNRLQSSALWDDQDLVREVLSLEREEEVEFGNWAALVVDEAQDFTPVELRLLTRAMVYSRYSHPAWASYRLPVILAGDPLQTLSPTGFKWDAIGAGLRNEIHNIVGDRSPSAIPFSLQNNYRSSPQIVGLANLVQGWRCRLFRLRELRGQGAWSLQEAAVTPSRFYTDDDSFSIDQFKRFLSDTPVILPVDNGGEIDFVKRDQLLSSVYGEVSEENPPPFVFSASAVKGLEFRKVVLYRFGEENQLSSFDWREVSDEGHRNLSIEYFFNKLYVGLTRATQSLFVLDSREGHRNLWDRLSEEEVPRFEEEMPSFLEPLNDKGIRAEFRGLVWGFVLDGMEESNPRENAEKIMRFGIDTRDSSNLRRAQSYFRQIGDAHMAETCGAYAAKFDDQHDEAARLFLKVRLIELAWESAWESSTWPLMADVLVQSPARVPQCMSEAVRLMSTRNPDKASVEDFLRSIGAAEVRAFPSTSSRTWSLCIDRVLALVDRIGDPDSLEERSGETLLNLAKSGFNRAALRAGKVLESHRNYELALEAWRLAGSDGLIPLALLNAKLDGLPRGLHHLAEVGAWRTVIEEWEKSGKSVDEEWISEVVVAFQNTQKPKDGLSELISAGAYEGASKFLWWLDAEEGASTDDFLNVAVAVGQSSDSGSVLAFVELVRERFKEALEGESRAGRASAKRARDSKEVQARAISVLLRVLAEENWPESRLGKGSVDALRSLLSGKSGVISWNEEMYSYLDALFLAAGYEVLQEWDRAAEAYLRVADDKDAFRKNVARGRWIYCSKRAQDQIEADRGRGRDRGRPKPEDLRRDRISRAAKWGIPDEDLRRFTSGPPRPVIVEASARSSKIHDSGNLVVPGYTFKFEVLRTSPRQVRLYVDTLSFDAYTLVCLVDDRFVRFQGEDYRTGSDVLRIELEQLKPYLIEFDFNSGLRLSISGGDGTTQDYQLFPAEVPNGESTGEAALEMRQQKPSEPKPTGRTTPKAKGVKIFELAAELRVKVEVVEGLMFQLGFGKSRGGNSRISQEIAQKIRDAYKDKGSN